MKHILYVEDDEKIAAEVLEKMESWGFLVTRLKTVAQTRAVDFKAFDLIVLDWNLPDGNGIEIAQNIRSQSLQVPILMITANVETANRKEAFKVKINDFLGKPFYFHELQARIEILVSDLESDTLEAHKDVIEINGIRIDKDKMQVYFQGKEISLKKKEYDLLAFFVTRPNSVLSRSEIIDQVWSEGEYPTTRTVDTHILNLRKKLKAEMFQTVWSTGYRFVVEEKS